jgi:ATP-binding cassette, subfamily G (WHITE), member 2, SNQ2
MQKSKLKFKSSGSLQNSEPDSGIHLLQNLNGAVQPGELVLVLGRPRSGCTTFLKALAGRLDANCRASGELYYAYSKESGKNEQPASRSVFCSSEDIHIPTLTVEQTLNFALKAKLPSVLSHQRKDVISKLLQVFNLTHQARTIVGDALMRGISGGEKKRLSIAEALIARPEVACWDNSTLGLDAGSAADFAKSLRILTKVYQMTTFVSLYQASDTIYDLFDKVLVLEGGQQLYFGPTAPAKTYFQSLGFSCVLGQPVSDFLADCADSRSLKPSHGVDTAQLATRYLESTMFKEVKLDRDSIIGRCIMATPAKKRATRATTSSIPYYNQIILTAKRHAVLRLQDKSGLLVKAVNAAVVSILVGTVYWQLPETSAGAFTRGGVIFITLLYNAFTAFAELPSAIAGRPILQKQTGYGLFRPSALYMGQFCVDVIFAAVEVRRRTLSHFKPASLSTLAHCIFRFYFFPSLFTSRRGWHSIPVASSYSTS